MIDLARKHETPKMFDRIAVRYDALNFILSFGLDTSWRKTLSSQLPEGGGLHVLDLATGTGDQLLSHYETGKIGRAIGLDPSVEMVTIAEKKFAKQRPGADVTFVEADAARIPFREDEFDAVSMSFGIRNVPNVVDVLKESHRVLKPNGRLLILEFSTPQNVFVALLYKVMLRTFVPLIGGIVSGNRRAYKYLDKSIEAFPSGAAFGELLHHAGFEKVTYSPLMLGAVTIYNASKE